MKGINYVIDDTGKQQAVLIDLNEWGDIWENLYDVLISLNRLNESKVSWDELKDEMDKESV